MTNSREVEKAMIRLAITVCEINGHNVVPLSELRNSGIQEHSLVNHYECFLGWPGDASACINRGCRVACNCLNQHPDKKYRECYRLNKCGGEQ